MGARSLLAAAVLLAGGAVACTDDPAPEPTPSGSPTATGSPTGSSEPSLEWRPVPGPVDETVTVAGAWTLTQHRDRAVLAGPERVVVRAPGHHRISQALLDEEYAVVVAEDELAERPDTATVVDLATGRRTVLDGDADVPTTVGGTWALGQGRLLHATVADRDYCLAEVDLAAGEGRVAWCAPRGHGFSDARVTPAGTSLLTFDDARPSCRTVVTLGEGSVEPFTDVPECTGWDGVVVDDDVTVWSVVPKARRVEEALLSATTPDGTVDLGPGTSGSLTWCGDAAWWVQDPQRSDQPARLLRWTPQGGTTTVYQTEARGRAFLSEPRCGGSDLTLSAFTAAGDEQVTASLG